MLYSPLLCQTNYKAKVNVVYLERKNNAEICHCPSKAGTVSGRINRNFLCAN